MKEVPVTQFSQYSIALLKKHSDDTVAALRSNQRIVPVSYVAQLLEEWQVRFDAVIQAVDDELDRDLQ